MKKNDHLTSDEIAAYAAKTLPSEEHRLVGGHLLRCNDCRNRLPFPSTKEFYEALLDEKDEPESRG